MGFTYDAPEEMWHVGYEWKEAKSHGIIGKVFHRRYDLLEFLKEENHRHDLYNVVITHYDLTLADQTTYEWEPPSDGGLKRHTPECDGESPHSGPFECIPKSDQAEKCLGCGKVLTK